MNTTIIILVIVLLVLIVTLAIGLISIARTKNAMARMELQNSKIDQTNAKLDSYFTAYGEMVAKNQKSMSEQQDMRLKSMEDSLARLRNDNNTQIESMKRSVDEKLEQVYKGLGEMQSVASNVGDLKKILSNVKTRGILGEVQLAAILEQILNREQYEENVATIKGSKERVEFAIRLPGDGEDIVYLPIDSKFPGDTYAVLMDAYESGDKDAVAKAKTALRGTLKTEAKMIRTKYVAPPDTTDFGIMFLPFEGLYAEAVNMGMVEELQREYKVTIAGPTTMAALLNSLQMGFNTLAIEKKSSEVWKVLSEVKKEFESFEGVLRSARQRVHQVDEELEKLEGTRTRAINRKLRDVMVLDDEAPDAIEQATSQFLE